MRIACGYCLLLFLAVSCSHRHYLDPADGSALLTVNERASQEACAVRTLDGKLVKVKDLTLGADTTCWHARDTGEAVKVPTHEVEYISFADRRAGLVEGAGVGFATGVFLGGFLGYITGSEEDASTGGDLRSESAFIGAIIFGVPMAVVGAIIGGAGGSRDFYCPVPSDSLSESTGTLPNTPLQPTGPRPREKPEPDQARG